MSTVTIHQARTNLSKLIQTAPRGGRGDHFPRRKTWARFVGIGEVKGKRVPGSLKGTLKVGKEFFEPLPENELARWG